MPRWTSAPVLTRIDLIPPWYTTSSSTTRICRGPPGAPIAAILEHQVGGLALFMPRAFAIAASSAHANLSARIAVAANFAAQRHTKKIAEFIQLRVGRLGRTGIVTEAEANHFHLAAHLIKLFGI